VIKIYSKKEPNKLLHIINRLKEIKSMRTDIIEADHFLQLSALRFSAGHTFKPHKHIWKEIPGKTIAQESWVVISGKVKCYFYDIDDSILGEWELNPGDVSVTLYGAHTYEILEEDTIVYEYKSGPYLGLEKDKVFI